MIKYGLDIGSCGLRILGGDISRDSFKILGGVSIPVEGYWGGIITDKRKLLYTILEAVRQFELKYNKRPSCFVVGVSTPQLSYMRFKKKFNRRDEDSAISAREILHYQRELLEEMVPLDEREIFYELEEFIVDGQKGIVNAQGLYASSVEIAMNAITLPLNFYNNILSLFSELGLEVEDVIPEVIAQSQMYLSPEEKKLGVMFINYGWGTLKVAVFKNGVLKYYKHFPSNLSSILDLMGEIYHLDNCASLEVLKQIFLTENSGIKFQSKSCVQAIPSCEVRNLINKNIYRIFYQVRKDLESQEIPLHFKRGIKISGGVIVEYPEMKDIAQDVFHQPAEIVEFISPGVDAQYITAWGLIKSHIYKSRDKLENKSPLSKFIGKILGVINKYF